MLEIVLLKLLHLVDDHYSPLNLANKVQTELHDQDKGKKRGVYQKLSSKEDNDMQASLVLSAL